MYHFVQGKSMEALSAFSEDVYYCSLEYGPEDVRTSLGYYNMGKVFGAKVGGLMRRLERLGLRLVGCLLILDDFWPAL